MMILTHITMANYMYKAYKHIDNKSFSIDKNAFIYGNIFPDISKLSKIKHHFSMTYTICQHYLDQVENNKLTNKERSLALGIVCHFLCDYFCKFHAMPPYNEASIVNHICYELKLHFHILYDFIKRSFTLKKYRLLENNLHLIPNEDTTAMQIVVDLLIKYYDEHALETTDMYYSITAMNQVMNHLMLCTVYVHETYVTQSQFIVKPNWVHHTLAINNHIEV